MATAVDERGWTLVEGDGPLVATAIHDGHELRPEVAERVVLSEEGRFREEDPFTAPWAAMAPTRLVVRRSRFEFDLNRPRERAVYVRPEDAWGLRVWRQEPPAELVQRSLEHYDAFYGELRRILDTKVAAHGRFVVFDLHSYNHRRLGPDALFDAQSKHPDVNLGTASLNRPRWASVVERVLTCLRSSDNLGRALDARENVKFQGGAMSRWIHQTYPETGCSLAIEFKKFFMDEWTGQLYPELHRGIGELLRTVAAAVADELEALQAPDRVRAAGERFAEDADYGRYLVGLWRCPACGEEVLPRQLAERRARRPFLCARCETELRYTEHAE